MELLTYVLIGFLIGILCTKKPIKFVIRHEHDYPQTAEIPSMEDLDLSNATQEDNIYEQMGAMIDSVGDLMGGK